MSAHKSKRASRPYKQSRPKPFAAAIRKKWRRGPAAPLVRSDLPGERLQKVLAAEGIASRREAEQLILEGRVEVDGQVVMELGTRVDRATQRIFVDGEPLRHRKRVYFAVHKPPGVVCTARDPAGRPRVTDLLPPDVGRVFNVGRLDLSSEGLILMTNDGELANRLTHPRHGVRKVYEVRVAGEPTPEVIAQLRHGMYLAEGFAKPVDVRIKSRRKQGGILEMVLEEGRNREVRRLLARVGHKVQRLIRVAVGPIRLGELPRGAFRQLTPEEVRKLHAVAFPSRSTTPDTHETGARPATPRQPTIARKHARTQSEVSRHARQSGTRQPTRKLLGVGKPRKRGRP